MYDKIWNLHINLYKIYYVYNKSICMYRGGSMHELSNDHYP